MHNKYLTEPVDRGMVNPVVVNPTTGIDTPLPIGAKAPTEGVFLCLLVFGGLHGATFGLAVPVGGSVNFVQPATPQIDTCSGGSQSLPQESIAMSQFVDTYETACIQVRRSISLLDLLITDGNFEHASREDLGLLLVMLENELQQAEASLVKLFPLHTQETQQ